jgi:dimethylhistidine N-methyltransferase
MTTIMANAAACIRMDAPAAMCKDMNVTHVIPMPATPRRVAPPADLAAVPAARPAGVRIVRQAEADPASDRAALIAGLLAPTAAIPPKYFYDPLGCALFGAICLTPEYYPTRTEAAIFAAHRSEIAAVLGTGRQLVDLGAGDCAKSRAWLPALRPPRLIAVDIAAGAIETALHDIAAEHPALECVGVVTDFTKGLDIDAELAPGPATFFYPGSSIGNFAPDDARTFIAQIAAHCARRPGSGLLIGVDMQKDEHRLVAAYDDAAGVTAAFNRNVLSHVNGLLDADFDLRGFAHVARYDRTAGRIEMHLQAIGEQVVTFAGHRRVFAAGERILTEHSYKYTPSMFTHLLNAAGFARVWSWQDAARDFAVFYAH